MGYDMYAVEPTGDHDLDYFRLNVWGMSNALEAMAALDMVTDAPHADEWPDPPEGNWVDREEAVPGTPWDEYHNAARAIRAEHPNRDDPRTPIHKFGSNDGWIVTPIECRALVGIARSADTSGVELPEWWADWIDYIGRCATRGGFEVW